MASFSNITNPPEPVITRAISSDETGLRQQGRTSTGIAAEVASAALRDFARGRPHSNRSSTALTISTESSRSAGTRQSAPVNPFAPRSSPQRSLSSPASPTSPISHSSSRSVSPSACPNDISEFSIDIVSHDGSRNVAVPTAPPTSPNPTRAQTGHQRPTGLSRARQGTSAPSSQPRTPLKLSDLGREYSRYPFKGPDGSSSMPPTPAPLYPRGSYPGAGRSSLPSSPAKGSPAESVTHIGYIIDPEKASAWLLDDRIGAPLTTDAAKFPLYTDEKELDDELHNPQPDDDERLRPKWRDFFTLRQFGSLFGLVFLLAGIFTIFILLPVLSYTGHRIYSYPRHSPAPDDDAFGDPANKVNDVEYPLLKNIRTGLIDPNTPESAMERTTFDGQKLELVFSDEFNTPNRTFYPGDDPYWTAPDIWYGSTQDLEWYDPDAATTSGGTLTLLLEQFFNHNLNYRSGMLNSWNQVCFKGGALEVSVSLPGPGGASGLWPGVWTLGNLGRPGYKASTEGLWPYTYNSCDAGITPNQSMTDGTSYLFGQKLPSCTCPDEDHPTPGIGRGAPEIDVFEAGADPRLNLGVITQSYQVAPFDIWYQPNYDHFAIPNYNVTQMNSYCGGPFQQAVSGQTLLNNQWYDGKLYQRYGFEYDPGVGSEGRITWYVGDDMSFTFDGNAVGPNGNVDYRPISQEPMSIVLNLGFSPSWTEINMAELRFPTTMYVDYVRWYQKPGEHSVTCDPPGYQTTQYIKDHLVAYTNPNLTTWNETGFAWPKHKLNTDC